MSKLTKTIQECGLHCGCDQGEQFFISEKEAIAIREKVKNEIMFAMKEGYKQGKDRDSLNWNAGISHAINLAMNVE